MLGGNNNHPTKGSKIKVGPILDLKDVCRIASTITNPMHKALFVTGCNTAFRASDLVRLTVGQVKGLKPMDHIEVKEQKTGKVRMVTFNEKTLKVLLPLCNGKGDTERLFPLTVPSVHRLVKWWCSGLKGNYGSHSMRKTFGYHQHKTFGVSLADLCEVFGHSSEKQTLTYLSIQREDIKKIYANEI